MHRYAAVLLPLLLLVAACDKPTRPNPSGPGISAKSLAATVEQVPTATLNVNDSQLTSEQRAIVVAKIGDHAITLGEIEGRVAREPPVVRSQFASVLKRKEYLTMLLEFELLAAEAARRGLQNDPEVVEAAKQAMIRKYLSDVAVDSVKPESFSDTDLRTYYDANPNLYHKPEQVEVSHILLKDEATAQRVARELRAASDGIAAKAVAAWNEYVGRYSQDESTIPYLGSLGLVSKTAPLGASAAELERLARVPADVIEIALTRKNYDIGSPVHSPQGWHVIMVTSRVPAVEKTFDEAKDSIRARLVKRERDLKRQQLLASLRAAAKIELNEEALGLLPVPAPPTGGKGQPQGAVPPGVTNNKQPADPTPSEL